MPVHMAQKRELKNQLQVSKFQLFLNFYESLGITQSCDIRMNIQWIRQLKFLVNYISAIIKIEDFSY